MFNTHNRLTGEVISQLKSCYTSMTTHCRCVLWVSLSRLIDRVMDPRSIGKAVHCNITMPQCNPKYIHPQCDFNRFFCSFQIDKLLYLFCIYITKLLYIYLVLRALEQLWHDSNIFIRVSVSMRTFILKANQQFHNCCSG